MTDPLFLGIDLSTQQIKCVIINAENKVVYRDAVNFSNHEALKEFGTKDGVHISTDCQNEGQTITSPVKMWLRSIDILFANLRDSGMSQNIQGISGCAQQHGTVYWRNGEVLRKLDGSESLEKQLESAFSVQDSPVWMDSSTQKQCNELEQFIGGAEKMTKLTGSRAHHRFSGAQIKKLRDTSPQIYTETERIAIVSSFFTSLLIGKYAGIDWSDASGANLMDIETKQWNGDILRFIDRDLAKKLGELVDPQISLGSIHPFWTARYNLPSTCQILPFLGDNPSSLAGLSLLPNDIGISLGTSDTVFFHTSVYKYSIDAHVFAYNNEYMPLVCFKNGSLTRERARQLGECADWSSFHEVLGKTTVGNGGKMGFFFDSDEIAPNIRKGDQLFDNDVKVADNFDKLTTCRAIFESQCYLKLLYTKKMGAELTKEHRLIVTGGASRNLPLLQMLADVFNCSVFTIHVEDSAALGGAMRAKYDYYKPASPYHIYFANANQLTPSASPIAEHVQIYQQHFHNFEKCFELLK